MFGAVVGCGVLVLAGCDARQAQMTQDVEQDRLVFTGLCDASAAAALNGEWMVVANDEDNVLRTFALTRPEPVAAWDLSEFLRVDPEEPETDIEGAARVGDRIYWITSHGTSRRGRARPSRHRFFATRIQTGDGVPALRPVGAAYEGLLRDLASAPPLRPFELADAATREPKSEGALNIEGLAAMGDGRLLIGFRNPIPGGKALLVPLLNPEEVVTGGRARLDAPVLLDLQGLGIRDLAFADGEFVIAAGSYDGSDRAALYRWAGPGREPERIQGVQLAGFNPEAVLMMPGRSSGEFLLLSDDGSRKVGGQDCKELDDPGRRRFRAMWVRGSDE